MSKFELTKLSDGIDIEEQSIPPLEQWNPEFCGEIDMRIARDGTWYHEGSPIGRASMVKMFSRILWQENNVYYLKTPVEKVEIQVDDLPFLFIHVEAVESAGKQQLVFTGTAEDRVVAGPEHPLVVTQNRASGEPEPALSVRFGMWGRINRNVFYQLVEMGSVEPCAEGGEELVIYSCGERYSLGRL